MLVKSKLPGLVVVVAIVVVAPNDIAEVAGVPKLPKLVEGAAAVDADGQPPADVPKPNCGLLKM